MRPNMNRWFPWPAIGRCFGLGLRGVSVGTVVLTVLVNLLGCNKGTDPKPLPKYLLYATIDGYPTGSIAVIDCETDSVINYIRNMSEYPDVVASPDGRYLAVLASGAPAQIFDAATLLPLKSLAAPGLSPVFVPDAGILVCPDLDSTLVYSMPDFTVKEVWHRRLEQLAQIPGRKQVAAVEWDARTTGLAKLLFYDYVSSQVVDSIVMEPNPRTIGFQILNFAFSPNGERLYALGWLNNQSFLIGYDLGTRQTLFLQPVYASLGSCKVTPDGREVWATEFNPGYEDLPSWPQAISIFDAIIGTKVDTVSTRGVSPNRSLPLAPRIIRILPDGSKAYISCGDFFKGAQPILVINTATRRIERLIFGDFERSAWWIDIAPRL